MEILSMLRALGWLPLINLIELLTIGLMLRRIVSMNFIVSQHLMIFNWFHRH